MRICINFQSLSLIPSHTFSLSSLLYFPSFSSPHFHTSLLFFLSQMWPKCCDAMQGTDIFSWMLLFFLPHHRPPLATVSSTFSPPVVSAVIDMPPAINQHSSRLLLSEGTGLAALEKRAREGELIQLSSQDSPTAHHFTSLWNFFTAYMKTHHHPISSHHCQTK